MSFISANYIFRTRSYVSSLLAYLVPFINSMNHRVVSIFRGKFYNSALVDARKLGINIHLTIFTKFSKLFLSIAETEWTLLHYRHVKF